MLQGNWCRKIHGVRLDAAHDNEPTYALVRSLGARPFIDLHMGVPLDQNGKPRVIKNTEHIGLGGVDATGTPHCLMGPMAWRSFSGGYERFACPARGTGQTARMPPCARSAAPTSSRR